MTDSAAEQPDVADVPGERPTGTTATPAEPVDLDAVERDLAAVEVALSRLADGTYWTDEVTGEPITDDVLTHDPLARRV